MRRGLSLLSVIAALGAAALGGATDSAHAAAVVPHGAGTVPVSDTTR